jgi:hypothetical protein
VQAPLELGKLLVELALGPFVVSEPPGVDGPDQAVRLLDEAGRDLGGT